MLVPIRTDSPLRSTPWMNWVLIAVNALIFAADWKFDHAGFGGYELHPNSPRLVTYFTYAFLHADTFHLLGNMLFLYIFGNNVNDKMGSIGYLGFYLAGAVFAGVGHVIAEPVGDAYPVIGASGAVAAVTGAYLALFPRSSITVIYFFLIIGSFEVASMYFIIFFLVKDLIPLFAAAESDVAHVAHIAGLLFGFAISMLLLSARLLPRDQFDMVALLQRWNKRRQYQNLVKQGYDPFAYIPPAPTDARQEIDPLAQRIMDLRAEISESIAHHNLPHAAALYLELKKLDPKQVLSRQNQLDVANQLASQQFYAQAADAYAQFLETFPNYEQIEQVELMVGLICARYLEDYPRACDHLRRALLHLHSEREIQLARAELNRIEPLIKRV